MTLLNVRRLSALLFAVALALPAPQDKASALVIGTCAGGQVTIPVSGGEGPGQGDDHGCCKRACHAGTDRRKRGGISLNDCC